VSPSFLPSTNPFITFIIPLKTHPKNEKATSVNNPSHHEKYKEKPKGKNTDNSLNPHFHLSLYLVPLFFIYSYSCFLLESLLIYFPQQRSVFWESGKELFEKGSLSSRFKNPVANKREKKEV